MTRWRFVLLVAAVAAGSRVEAETLDIATFDPPAGWSRDAQPQGVRFTLMDADKRAFGSILIFASIQSSGDPERDFASAWQSLMAAGTAATAKKVRQPSPQGFPMVIGAAQTTEGGIPLVTMLATITAHQRVVCIMAKTNSQDVLAKIDAFVMGVKLAAAPAPSVAAGGGLDDYLFQAPPGWKTTRTSDQIQLTDEAGGCTLLLLPPRPAAGSIEEEVNRLFATATAGWSRENGIGMGEGPYYRMFKGVAADGWEYMRVEGFVEREVGGGKLHALTSAFVARLDGRVAMIVGSRAGPNAYFNMRQADVVTRTLRCLDDDMSVDWPMFLLSLRLKGWPTRPSGLDKKIVGKWWSSWSGGAMGYVFAANGRYDTIVGYQTLQRIDPVTLQTTTTGLFPGSGSWKLDGNQLTLTPDAKDVRQVTFGVRSEMVWDMNGWTENLRLSSREPPQRSLRRE